MRHFRFHLYVLFRHRFQWVFAPMVRSARNYLVLEWFYGIKIVDTSMRRKFDHRFQADTVAALQLVRSVDPRRFRRIQREIEFIVNQEATNYASYDRPTRSCIVDYDKVDHSEYPEWYLWQYASTLVHEATHGALYSRHIAYTPALRARIERLCHTEQTRFAAKAYTPEWRWSHNLAGDFNEGDWHGSWHSTFLQRCKGLIARLREARRKLPKK
jgi:hypothetical protein